MKLTKRQYEVLRFFEDNDAIASTQLNYGWYGGLSASNGNHLKVNGNILNALRQKKAIELYGKYDWRGNDYKISSFGIRALREYEEKK